MVRTTQVQRLMASKLAIPSVGGTINILTGGDESANGARLIKVKLHLWIFQEQTQRGVRQPEKGLHMVGSFKPTVVSGKD